MEFLLIMREDFDKWDLPRAALGIVVLMLFCALAPQGLAHAATIGMPQNNLGLVGYWPR